MVPADADLQRAASILNEGMKVAMLVGAGALRASAEALFKGEPDEGGIIHQSFTELVAKLLPHRPPRRR